MILGEKTNLKIMPWEIFKQSVISLLDNCADLDKSNIRIMLKQFLPSYKPSQFDNKYQQNLIKPYQDIKVEA